MTPGTADDKARPLSKIRWSNGNYLVSWIPYNHEKYIDPRRAVVHWSEEAAQETASALKRHHKRWNGDYQDLTIQLMETYPNKLTNVPIVEPAKSPAKVLAPLAGQLKVMRKYMWRGRKKPCIKRYG